MPPLSNREGSPRRGAGVSVKRMATALVAASLACAGAGWLLRAFPLQLCQTAPVVFCGPVFHPFAQVGALCFVMSGVGLVIALIWLVGARIQSRRMA